MISDEITLKTCYFIPSENNAHIKGSVFNLIHYTGLGCIALIR